jgi:predicted Na+-dependent transporter
MTGISAYAKFVREKYTYIILTTLVVAVIVGLFTSSPGVHIRQANTPLIVIMIAAMGFTITFKSLGLAARDWKGFSFGIVLNFLFAPFLCWLLAKLFLSSHTDLAAGLILIGAVPCAVNTWGMFQQLIYTVLLPVLGGVALRELIGRRITVQKYLPVMPAISATMAVLLMFMALNTNISPIMKNVGLIGPLVASTILIFPILFIVAYLVSIKFFPKGKNIAITYSSGMKNLPIAIGIAAMSFKGLQMLPIAVGFAFQMLTAVSFYQLFRRAAA